MTRGSLQYRGSLKSCNYSCSYCPFAKRRASKEELEQDKRDWLRFCSSLERKSESGSLPYGAVMVVPYGEALIHSCYWEGLARLSQIQTLEMIGAQTNLSFDISRRLLEYEEAGGQKSKLRLWATFHPEMTTAESFADQCRKLLAEGIRFGAGSVGVPENIEILRYLRKILPEHVYLWINRMDGLNRRYSDAEEAAFQEIDPLFSQELHWPKADSSSCSHRLFVEADGRMRLCNIGRPLEGNWYGETDRSHPSACGKKMCSCYLAYGGRDDYGKKWFFGRYPLFRIPWKPKALFLDLDGTLIPDVHGGKISEALLKYLEMVSQQLPLFLATSLTNREAAARCPEILPLLAGGIYASGAHVAVYEVPYKMECFHEMDAPWLSGLAAQEKYYGFRAHFYLHNEAVYKVTLAKPRQREWRAKEVRQIMRLPLFKTALASGKIRYFSEKNCLQIVCGGVDKGSGIRRVCKVFHLNPAETAAVGNALEDIAMFRVCGLGAAVAGGPEEVRKEADLVIHHAKWSAVCPVKG